LTDDAIASRSIAQSSLREQVSTAVVLFAPALTLSVQKFVTYPEL